MSMNKKQYEMKDKIQVYVAQPKDLLNYEIARWNELSQQYEHLEDANSYDDAKVRARQLNNELEEQDGVCNP